MRQNGWLVIGIACAVAACGSPNDEAALSSEKPGTGAQDPMASNSTVDASLAQTFVDKIASSDQFEIEAGEIAQKMGGSAQIKDFGVMMVREHTTSSNELKNASAEAQPPLPVIPSLTDDHRAKLEALRKAGAGFDALYAQQQIAAHEAALATLREYSASGTVAPLKEFATDTAVIVERHLEHARALR